MDINLAIPIACMLAPTAAGYVARRAKLLPERAAAWIMTGIVVFGYSAVALLTIWKLQLKGADAWLPILGMAHVCIMTGAGLIVGRVVTGDRSLGGLFALATAVGNTGFTLGGFVIYLLEGEPGLAMVSIYGIMWIPMTVLLMFPIARHYSDSVEKESLTGLMLRGVLNWRSAGLAMGMIGVALSLMGVPRPDAIDNYRILDILVFLVTPLAYFAIGLRLHVGYVRHLTKMLAALAGMRFALGLGVGLFLVWATGLTPFALTGLGWRVVIIESFVPTSVTMVAVANMFHLRPREGSALFVVNTAAYLLIVLPIMLFLMK